MRSNKRYKDIQDALGISDMQLPAPKNNDNALLFIT